MATYFYDAPNNRYIDEETGAIVAAPDPFTASQAHRPGTVAPAGYSFIPNTTPQSDENYLRQTYGTVVRGADGNWYAPTEKLTQMSGNQSGGIHGFLKGPGAVLLPAAYLGAAAGGLMAPGAGAGAYSGGATGAFDVGGLTGTGIPEAWGITGGAGTGAGAGAGFDFANSGFNPWDPSTWGGQSGNPFGSFGAEPGGSTFLDPSLAPGAASGGAPFQPGFNLLDPSTYGGASGGFSIPNIPGLTELLQQGGSAVSSLLSGGAAGAGGGPGGGFLQSFPGILGGLYDLFGGGRGDAIDPAKLETLWQAGIDTYNMGRDPQDALYNRTVQQLQDQTRAGQSARGTAMSPFGAAGEADVMKNFNIDWQNNLLDRQLKGLSGLSEATGGYYRQANEQQEFEDSQQQRGVSALGQGLQYGLAPGGWLNTLWNSTFGGGATTPAGQTPAVSGPNYWGSATPSPASFANPQFNMFDPNTYFGGAVTQPYYGGTGP